MTYVLSIADEAKSQFEFWKKSGQTKILLKIRNLLQELQDHPTTGTGKVEQLRGNNNGLWSRRIDHKNRLVYSINDNTVTVHVISMLGHYDDK